ncbi:MAG: hypothetical protein Q9190_003134, partial [Brigantiaea leucoxantha]
MPLPSNLDPPPPLSDTPPPEEKQPSMHTSTSSTSTSSLVRGRPKTVYFHGGIGGAGNYRKVIRTDDENQGPHPRTEPRRSPLPRAFHSLFNSSGSGNGNGNGNGSGNNGGNGGGASSVPPSYGRPALTVEEELEHSKARSTPSPSRGFFGIGGLGNRRTRRQQSPGSDMTIGTNADSGYASQYSGQAVDLGAAELMRRKML